MCVQGFCVFVFLMGPEGLFFLLYFCYGDFDKEDFRHYRP